MKQRLSVGLIYDTENNEMAENNFIIHGNEYPFGQKLLAFAKIVESVVTPVILKVLEITRDVLKAVANS